MAAGQSVAATCASIFSSTNQIVSSPTRSASNTIITSVSSSTKYASKFTGSFLPRYWPIDRKVIKFNGRVTAAAAVASPAVATPGEEIKECTLPTWAEFELGRAPIFWKTTNALPPTAGENLKLFYNPAAKNLVPNEAFGIAFNGGFNQPIMCGGEPRAMLQKVRGKADPPFYTIQICIPKHALNLIFSFTNGNEWDGPYRLQFQVPKPWRNKPIEFFTEGLAQELSKEGACDRAIFPDTDVVSTRCAMIGNLTVEGGDRCDLDLVLGCTDPSSPLFDPLANVDDGTCPPYSDSEEQYH